MTIPAYTACQQRIEDVEQVLESVSRNACALTSLVRLKTVSDFTYMHSVAVCALMVSLAGRLGLDHQQTCSAGMARECSQP